MFRPRPRHSLPLLVLVGLGDVALIGLSIGFHTVRNFGSSIAMLGVGLVITAALAAYFRNAAIYVDNGEVGKIDLLGRRTHFQISQLVRIKVRFSPQPNLLFVGKDGRRLFRVNTRLWTDQQIQEVQDALWAAGWRQQTDTG